MILIKDAAVMFGGMASESKLNILKVLIEIYPEWITVGEIKNR